MREAATLLATSLDTAPSADLRNRVLSDIRTVRPLPPTAPAPEVVRRTARWFPKLAAAAVAAVVLATGVGVSAWHPWSSPTTSVQADVAARVLDASDARRQTMDIPGGGTATVVHSRSVGRAVLITKHMPPAPVGKVYELWLQDPDGVMVPAGLMDHGGDQTVVLQGSSAQSTGIGITVEPAGGVKHPGTEPVANFDLRRSV